MSDEKKQPSWKRSKRAVYRKLMDAQTLLVDGLQAPDCRLTSAEKFAVACLSNICWELACVVDAERMSKS